MRFSDLKKKFPSLRVGVLVIAAFALLGLMMLPSVNEKMGLNGSLCVAEYGYQDECDTEYRNSLQCEMDYEECIADVESSLEALIIWFEMGDVEVDEELEEALDWMTEAACEDCLEDLDDCLED